MSTTHTGSLVDLAARKELPLHQFTDAATVEWIKTNRPDFPPTRPSPLHTITKTLIESAAIPTRWLAEPRLADSIHGHRHALRTAVLAALLADRHGLDESDTAVVVIAAAVHDCQRHHDKDDPGHGGRAAVWLAANADPVWTHFRRRPRPSEVIKAVAAVRLHEVPYEAFTAADRADHSRAERVCDVVKAADALDRYRLPKLSWWPNRQYVREPAFDELLPLAHDLVVISEEAFLAGATSAAAVRYATAEKGLV
ncbi:HD domain-containing protein [Kitasatospora griseola]